MENFTNILSSMGPAPYIFAGFVLLSLVFAFLSLKMNKNAIEKWLSSHPGAVKIVLESGSNIVTSKQLLATVVKGEAAVFFEKTKCVIYAIPGDIVLEVTYTYTRPGVLHKTVSTTWGPAKVEITVEKGKEYQLNFDKKEETFKLTSENI